jgi:hypothetical protein
LLATEANIRCGRRPSAVTVIEAVRKLPEPIRTGQTGDRRSNWIRRLVVSGLALRTMVRIRDLTEAAVSVEVIE